MSEHARGVYTFRRRGTAVAVFLSIVLSGCYTRQIEGIQKDLDLIDRKLHKANLSRIEKSAAVSPEEIIEIKRKLESVESQQMGLSSDLENLKSNVVSEAHFEGAELAAEPFPLPVDLPSSQEIEMLRKQVESQQKQIDRFEREMKEMQTTFDEVKASMLDVIQLIKEEYIEEEPVSDSVSDPGPSADSSSISMNSASESDSSGGEKWYEVKAGDSLNLIAKRHGVSVAELKEVNRITNPDRLIRGQKILIP